MTSVQVTPYTRADSAALGLPLTGGEGSVPHRQRQGEAPPGARPRMARRDPKHPTLGRLLRPPEPLIPSCWPLSPRDA